MGWSGDCRSKSLATDQQFDWPARCSNHRPGLTGIVQSDWIYRLELGMYLTMKACDWLMTSLVKSVGQKSMTYDLYR